MRILLVTSNNQLAEKLAALNPELEYCGIVVDEVEPAKEILEQVGLSDVPLYPIDELKTCAETLDYDYIVPVQDNYYGSKIMWELPKYNVEKSKVINFARLHDEANFKTEQVLRYYREHAQDFEIIVTGISTAFAGIDVRQFKRKCFNFALHSQDLYYDFETTKYAVLCGGGHSKLRYALIGLAPYSFHYDLSSIFRYRCRLLLYVIAFNDLHNFFMPVEEYRKFFREEWLNRKLPLEPFNEKIPYKGGSKLSMNQKAIDSGTTTWARRNHPETRDENVKILDDYLMLCEENNIRPIMFRVPCTEKYMANFNSQMLEEFYVLVEQALGKHPDARFFDGWKLEDFTYADFHNHEHLNIYGAAKFSSYLNDFIEQLEAQGG